MTYTKKQIMNEIKQKVATFVQYQDMIANKKDWERQYLAFVIRFNNNMEDLAVVVHAEHLTTFQYEIIRSVQEGLRIFKHGIDCELLALFILHWFDTSTTPSNLFSKTTQGVLVPYIIPYDPYEDYTVVTNIQWTKKKAVTS